MNNIMSIYMSKKNKVNMNKIYVFIVICIILYYAVEFTENLNTHILSQIEELTGKSVSATERSFIMHGPEEVDLVHSGLEETMITATREIMQIWKDNPSIPDMRTAAYVCAINKVGTSYAELGIFP